MRVLEERGPAVWRAIRDEGRRQEPNLELITSRSVGDDAALASIGQEVPALCRRFPSSSQRRFLDD